MTIDTETIIAAVTTSSAKIPRRIKGRIPEGCRTIQVIVPESTYFHVQTQAAQSRMCLAEYLVRYLAQARSLLAERS